MGEGAELNAFGANASTPRPMQATALCCGSGRFAPLLSLEPNLIASLINLIRASDDLVSRITLWCNNSHNHLIIGDENCSRSRTGALALV